jgi:flagellar biosynthesis/type III secretory pathway M-ring protein FliF/YscJ
MIRDEVNKAGRLSEYRIKETASVVMMNKKTKMIMKTTIVIILLLMIAFMGSFKIYVQQRRNARELFTRMAQVTDTKLTWKEHCKECEKFSQNNS